MANTVFAASCFLRQHDPQLVHLMQEYLAQVYGECDGYHYCCKSQRRHVNSKYETLVSVCGGCIKRYSQNYSNIRVKNFWDIVRENPQTPLKNADEIRSRIKKAFDEHQLIRQKQKNT